MGKKFTLEYVKKYFLDNDCKFLDDDYVGVFYSHNYICKCGNESKISFASFRNGSNCQKCGIKKSSDGRKLTLEYVKKYFLDNNCEFIDDGYKNANHSHNYQCKCGNKSKISFANFQNGVRCMNCGGSEKLTLEYVKKYFLDNDCKFLDNECVSARYSHNYICKCEQKSKISFSDFKNGRRCKKCYTEKQKHTLEYIKKYFSDNNCVFLDEKYINSRYSHNYICKCGQKSKICFDSFKHGKRCRNCAKNGFNSAKPSFVYLVGNHYRQKIGIMNENADRIKQHNKNFGLNLIDKIFFENGADAHELEQTILQKLKIKNIPHGRQVFTENFDGRTESWLLTDLEVTKIEELINL